MSKWRSKLARNAWAAFLLVFAIRAVAGVALCEMYGEHRVPPGTAHIVVQEHDEQIAPAMHGHGHHSSDEAPSNDRSDHACEEPVYLTGGLASASVIKWSMAMDAMACCDAPIATFRPLVVDTSVARGQLAHPPPSRAPLDISPRLRI